MYMPNFTKPKHAMKTDKPDRNYSPLKQNYEKVERTSKSLKVKVLGKVKH